MSMFQKHNCGNEKKSAEKKCQNDNIFKRTSHKQLIQVGTKDYLFSQAIICGILFGWNYSARHIKKCNSTLLQCQLEQLAVLKRKSISYIGRGTSAPLRLSLLTTLGYLYYFQSLSKLFLIPRPHEFKQSPSDLAAKI